MNDPTVEVYAATHKKIDFALPDYCRKIQVNAENTGQWKGYLHDNDGEDNISLKNPYYSELTALYSMWKNCKADIQGLCHYRRYFSRFDTVQEQEKEDYWQLYIPESILTETAVSSQAITDELKRSDVILPFPIYSAISIKEYFSAYISRHDIYEVCRVIEEYYPDYLHALHNVLDANRLSQCNMFIAGKEFVNHYCSWLFDVLQKLELRTSNALRSYGYFSEFLLNVYVIRHNLKCSYYLKALIRRKENSLKMALKKISGLSRLKHFMRRDSEAIPGTGGTAELDNFSVNFTRYSIGGKIYFIADFSPKNKDNFMDSFNDALNIMRLKAGKEKMTFLPRITLSPETSEAVKKILRELGVRIIYDTDSGIRAIDS